jgi:hypothetical protein
MNIGGAHVPRMTLREHHKAMKHSRRMRVLLSVCSNQQFVFPFSPAALQASLQTSTFQARNRTAGAVMSNFKKSDVKSHLTLRLRRSAFMLLGG